MKNQITRQQWDQVKDDLDHFHLQVLLMCDGYRVTLELGRISQFKNGIMVYVNGEFLGRWFVNDKYEEAKRFFPLRKKNLHSRAQRDRMYRNVGKRQSRQLGSDVVIESRGTYWTSFQSLKCHLVANNKSIELLETKK